MTRIYIRDMLYIYIKHAANIIKSSSSSIFFSFLLYCCYSMVRFLLVFAFFCACSCCLFDWA